MLNWIIYSIILSKCYAEEEETGPHSKPHGSGRIARKVRSDIVVVGETVVGPRISQGSGLHLSAFFCEFFLLFFFFPDPRVASSALPFCAR